jgi:hypothetical protein
MSLFTKLVKKSLKDFLRRWKKWIIATVVFLAAFIGLNYLLNHYIGKVVGTLVKEFVDEKSEGFYHVEFQDIAYILNTGTFYMSEFKFDIHPDYRQNLNYDKLPQNYIYTSYIPSLHIDIIDFWSIIVQRKLKVIGIEITSPYVRIVNLNKTKSPKKISFEAGNLYGILSGHLNELKINDFLISDGEFDYQTYQGADYDNFRVKGLTFEVNNFRLNEKSSTRKDKIFYTDDIRLEIKDQLLYLKDSIHKVTFDRFYISTSDNEFGFENFNLTRRANPHLKVQDHDHYEINLPSLRFSGIDFLNAYNNNLLVIDSINIPGPTVNIKKRTARDQKDSTRNNLLNVAMVYHDYLLINHFNLDDADLIYTDERSEIPKQYSIDHISAMITKVEIDTANHSKYQFGFNFEEVDLMVKDYEVTLPDSANTVTFKEFSISSNPFEIKLKDLKVTPNYKSGAKQKNLIQADIPFLIIKDFDVARAINKDTFMIEEIYLENSEIKIVQLNNEAVVKKQNKGFGGLFGVYEVIQQNSEQFILDRFNLKNGKLTLEKFVDEDTTLFSFNNINVSLENLAVDSLTNTKTDLLGVLRANVAIDESKVKSSGVDFELEHLSYDSEAGKLLAHNIEIASGANGNIEGLNLKLPELIVTSINPNEIVYDNKISFDTLKFSDVQVFMKLMEVTGERQQEQRSDKGNNFPIIEIDHLIGIDYDVWIEDSGVPVFRAENIQFDISELNIDQSLSSKPINQFEYKDVNHISVDQYELFLRKQHHLLKTDKILWNNTSRTFSIDNLALIPTSGAKNHYDIEVPKISMKGIDLYKVLKQSYYDGEEIIIDQPTINLKLAKGRRESLSSLDLGFIPLLLRNRYHGVKSSSFEVRNAVINIKQQAEDDSLIIEGDNFNLLVDEFEVDSTMEMKADRFLFANNVRLHGDYLSAFEQKNSNFFNINHYNISTREGNVKMQGIYFATNTKNEFPDKGHVRLTIDNFDLLGINFYDLTQNKTFDMEAIQIDNADLKIKKIETGDQAMTAVDSLKAEMKKYNLIETEESKQTKQTEMLEKIARSLGEELKRKREAITEQKSEIVIQRPSYLFDTLLLKNINIDRILLTDSKVDYKTTDDPNTGLLIPDIWFMAEGIKYDPVSALDSSRIFYSDNMVARLRDLNFVLPDNLSAIKVNELTLNSRDSTIKAENFGLIPLVDRYDYGIAKGYQSTWLKLVNDSVSLKKVNFLGLINQKKLYAASLNVYNAEISVFRDKRVPFPEWQRKPLPQTDLRNLNFTFGIDTINMIDGFITYQEHAEKAYTTGEVFFSDMDAKIVNLTNDSIRMLNNANARIGVTTDLFGKGAIKGEFLFDLVDMENIHTYGINVAPFDLTEFNRIMIPTASVEISSGTNNRIIMSAKANEDYSYGEMKFYYEDLKIQLLNRETETPKGLGNVLGSFFANTFIIKSNNPRNLFLRKGDIFFERDKKRAIFNYWTKTFLSGVVSSIGASNNKKKIKRMQEENLKKLQKEKADILSQ